MKKNLMLKPSLLAIIAVALLAGACKNVSYKKTKGGMPYKIYSTGDTTRVDTNDFIKIQYMTKLNDSVLASTFGKVPGYYQVVGMQQPYDISELFLTLKKGDSIIAVQLMDTFIKKMPGQIDPRFKRGDRITTIMKIMDVIKSPEEKMKDEEKEMQAYKQREMNEVQDFLTKRGVKTIQTKSGSFVEILENGTGPEIDSGNYVMLRYRGTTFDGKEFESNMGGPAAGFIPGAQGRGGSITGFDESLQLLSLGDRAKFYIPSLLAYGINGNRDPMTGQMVIQPYTNLIFEIVIDSVASKPPPEMVQPMAPPPQVIPSDTTNAGKHN